MGKKVSFCITCMDRLYQLRRTLPQNLKDNGKYVKDAEFILIDIGPTLGLVEWARETLGSHLKSGLLKIFQCPATSFHASIAKNTAHFNASGGILVNLDGDVLLGPYAVSKILRVMRRYKGRAILHMIGAKGTYGCIAYPRRHFFSVKGYDQSFGPVGCQDTDVILRMVGKHKLAYVTTRPRTFQTHRLGRYLQALGIRAPHHAKDLIKPKAIRNPKSATIKHTKVKDWKKANEANNRLMVANMKRKRWTANSKNHLGYTGVKRIL